MSVRPLEGVAGSRQGGLHVGGKSRGCKTVALAEHCHLGFRFRFPLAKGRSATQYGSIVCSVYTFSCPSSSAASSSSSSSYHHHHHHLYFITCIVPWQTLSRPLPRGFYWDKHGCAIIRGGFTEQPMNLKPQCPWLVRTPSKNVHLTSCL